MKKPQILIVVEDGVARHVPGPDDERVDVTIWDWDNFSAGDAASMLGWYAELPLWQQNELSDARQYLDEPEQWVTQDYPFETRSHE